jgi:hypothetical protein
MSHLPLATLFRYSLGRQIAAPYRSSSRFVCIRVSPVCLNIRYSPSRYSYSATSRENHVLIFGVCSYFCVIKYDYLTNVCVCVYAYFE